VVDAAPERNADQPDDETVRAEDGAVEPETHDEPPESATAPEADEAEPADTVESAAEADEDDGPAKPDESPAEGLEAEGPEAGGPEAEVAEEESPEPANAAAADVTEPDDTESPAAPEAAPATQPEPAPPVRARARKEPRDYWDVDEDDYETAFSAPGDESAPAGREDEAQGQPPRADQSEPTEVHHSAEGAAGEAPPLPFGKVPPLHRVRATPAPPGEDAED
jgi:hypothetical protein